MGIDTPTDGRISLEDAVEKTVGEVMIRRPKTLGVDALVRDVRRVFERPGVRTILLTDGDRFVGAIERANLPANAHDDSPARPYVDAQPLTARPEMPMSEALELLEGRGEQRLIVLDGDNVTLRGLLCANGSGTAFCVR